MVAPVIRHNKNMLNKWFGTNRGTHWTVAGSIAVIIIGSYLIYNGREHTTVGIAAEQSPPIK
jgi:hypothetical protein